jgi:hypothetical protein
MKRIVHIYHYRVGSYRKPACAEHVKLSCEIADTGKSLFQSIDRLLRLI